MFPSYNDFEKGNTDVFKINKDVDVGTLGCLIISAGSENGWLIESVALSSDKDTKGISGGNKNNVWMSTDTSLSGDAGKLAKMWCAPPAQ